MDRKLLLLLIFIFTVKLVNAQEDRNVEGTITHITSTSVYLRLQNTSKVSKGDTLYLVKDGYSLPALIVTGKSSLSIVATPIAGYVPNISDKIVFKIIENNIQSNTVTDLISKDSVNPSIPAYDTISKSTNIRKQLLKGKVSATSYSTFSNSPTNDFHRFRYNLNLQMKNIGGSRLSAETYISFVHKTDYWNTIQDNIFNGLKIYNLALIYEVTDKLTITGGRKINSKLSSMGPVDGLQAEYKLNSITIGALVGERPNFYDYRFNFIKIDDTVPNNSSLFQYGLFFAHDRKVNKGNIQTTVAFVDQKNGGITDRRFTYIQHSNSMFENLFFFGSVEFDMYKMLNETTESSPYLTNLYLSGRYRILRNLSLSLSYSARKNVIYYETYKSFIDRYIENEMQQGYTGRINYNPLKKLSLGASAGFRKREDDSKPSKNAYIYASYNQLPIIGASLTVSATLLETTYLSGSVYAISLNQSFIKNKFNATLTYRFQEYQFLYSEQKLKQHCPEISFNWYLIKKLSLGCFYEATIEDPYLTNRVHLSITKRF